MKIIITESKRHNIVTKWLNDNHNNLDITKIINYYYQFHEGDNTMFYIIDDTLFFPYNSTFFFMLNNLFGLSVQSMLPILKPWLLSTYDFEINVIKNEDKFT